MDVFLLRTSLIADDSRAAFLSAEGRQLIRSVGHRVHATERLEIDRILVGPSAADVQTAELFAERLDYVGVVEVMPTLAPLVPPEVAAPLVLAAGRSVIVVADEPTLSNLGAFLIGRPTFPPHVRGQLSAIRDRQPAWCLRPGDLARSLLLVA